MIIPLSNFLIGLGRVLHLVILTCQIIVVASAVISWVNADPRNPIVRFLRSATEPVYRMFRRRFTFLYAGGIDFTPMVVILLLIFLDNFLVGTLIDYGYHLRAGIYRG